MNGRQFEDRDRTEKHRQHSEKRANTTGRGIDISEIFSLPAPRTMTSQVLERIPIEVEHWGRPRLDGRRIYDSKASQQHLSFCIVTGKENKRTRSTQDCFHDGQKKNMYNWQQKSLDVFVDTPSHGGS